MALDKNGGLAVDEFIVKVNTTSTGIDEHTSLSAIALSQTLTNDIVNVSSLPYSCRLKLVSLEGCEEAIPLLGNTTTINLRHLSSGMYFLVFTEATTGESRWKKIIKY